MPRAGFVTRFLNPCAVAAFLGLLAACGGGGGGGEPVRTVTTVTVSSPTSTPKQGDTVQLTAVARDQFGDVVPGATATWSSSAPSVATVSATGLLQALAGGSVTVTATISNVSGTLTLTITPRVTTTVTVSSPTASPTVGETVQLTVVARDQFGEVLSGKTATWSTSDAKVATISPTGLLQAVAPGTVVATATIDGLPGSLMLTVLPGAAASVTVTSPTATPQAGEAVQLTAVVRDRDGNLVPGVTVGWSTSDARIATVTASGLLQAQTPGSVVVTASTNGASGSLTLAVVPGAVASVTVSAPTLTPKEGDTVQLTATARDRFGNIVPGVTATWSVSDAALAAVSATGLLQTYTTGAVQARATVAGVSGTVSLTVSAIKVAVTIGKSKEVVFAYKRDHCPDSDLDFPDLPPHVVRAEDGSLVLFAGAAPRYYVSRGADFNSLKRDCSKPVLVSVDSPTPQSYENREWISAVYREGNRWHAIISNEYHDLVASTCRSSDPSISIDCLYLSATYGVSTDGARTFTKPSPPAHVILPPPYVWEPPLPGAPPNWEWGFHEGYNAPYSLIRKDDGYFYAIVGLAPSKSVPYAGQCLLRTDRLDDPASWRAWDGTGFNDPITSPYVTGNPAPLCKVSRSLAEGLLTFNTYLNRYMNVDIWHSTIDGKLFCTFSFRLSADLLHWSSPQLITEPGDAGFCPFDPQQPGLSAMYPTVIDHADTTINFERPGRTPYLYYVRINDGWKDRDLIRVQLTFTRLD